MRRVYLLGCATFVLLGGCGGSDDKSVDAKPQPKYDVAVPNAGIDAVSAGLDSGTPSTGAETGAQVKLDGGLSTGIDTSAQVNLDGAAPALDAGIDSAAASGPDGKPDVAVDTEADVSAVPDVPQDLAVVADGNLGVEDTAGGIDAQTSPLTFDVSTTVDPATPGGRLLYVVSVGNTSTVAVNGATLSWTVPAGLQFGNAADAEPNSSNCGGSSNLCTPNMQATWTLGSLPAGSSRTVSINAQVLSTVGNGDSITATFKLAATGLNPMTFTKTVQVYSASSAQLTTGTSLNPVRAGQHFTLDLDVGQIGTDALAGAVLRATLAPGLTVAAISDGGSQAASGVVSWDLGSIAVGKAVHRTIDVTVDGNVPAGALLPTRATVTYDGGLAVDAAAEYTIRVAAAASPIQINVAAATSPAVPEGRLVYTVTVGNVSTRSVEGVSVFLRVPAGVQFGNAGDSQPNSSNCNGSSNSCPADYEVVWSLGTMAAGSSQTIEINSQVVAKQVGNGNLIRALFVVTATGVEEIDDVRTVQVYDSPGAQLAFRASANPVTNDEAFSYDLDIGQIGLKALANAELRVRLPRGVTVGTVSDGGSQDVSGDVVWSIGSIAVASSLRRSVGVTGDGSALPGTILNARASLTYDGGAEVDAVTDYAVPVVPAAQALTLSVTATPNPVPPGGRLLYTATINNIAARSIADVQLMVRVPTGMQFGNAADADPHSSNCAGSSNLCTPGYEVYWTIGTLVAGGSQIVTVNSQILTSLASGSLIPMTFWLTATGLDAPIMLPVVAAAK